MNDQELLSLINPRILDLSAYHLDPLETEVKLNQNENPFDWPRAVKEEVARFCADRPWNRYPPFVPTGLKEALAAHVGVGSDAVIAGNGSNEMLLVLLLSLMRPGRGIIICQPTFTVYHLLAYGLGGDETTISLRDDLTFDVELIRRTAQARQGALLILTSPNNPTGTALSEAQIRTILEAHRGFLVLDQAYVEFGGFNAVPLLAEYPNLIITRTFSKAFAGAGLRLGYMLGSPPVISQINKIKLPYNINFFSEHVARVALAHCEWAHTTTARIVAEREALFAFLKSLPFENCYPSSANFVLVRTRTKDAFFEHLIKRGILVRDVSAYPKLQGCLRISVGTGEESRRLRDAAEEFFSAPR